MTKIVEFLSVCLFIRSPYKHTRQYLFFDSERWGIASFWIIFWKLHFSAKSKKLKFRTFFIPWLFNSNFPIPLSDNIETTYARFIPCDKFNCFLLLFQMEISSGREHLSGNTGDNFRTELRFSTIDLKEVNLIEFG